MTTTVHNIIVGKLWVDEHGDMEIFGEGAASGLKCHLKYLPYSYFSKEAQRKVSGHVVDTDGRVSSSLLTFRREPFRLPNFSSRFQPKWVIQGYWDSKIEIAPVIDTNSDSTVCKTGKFITAWERILPPKDSDR